MTAKTREPGVYKRGTTYSYVVSVGRDPDTGKRRQQWIGGFPTVKAAAAARRDALTDLDKGTYVPPTRQTVAEWLTGWLEAQASQLKPSTLDSYRWLVQSYVIPTLGGIELQALTPPALTRFYTRLHSEGGHNGKPLSLRTVRYVHSVVRKALGDAVKARALVVNPALAADVPKRPHEETEEALSDVQAWTAGEVRTFLDVVPEGVWRALWATALNTGLRRGELLALSWADVDLDEPRMHVRWNAVMAGGELRYGTPKGGSRGSAKGGRRSFRLDPMTVAVLRAWRKRQAEERLAWSGEWGNSRDLIFCHADGTTIRPDAVTKRFATDLRTAGVRRIRLHDTRHTYATLALQAGVPIKVVSERLGHVSVQITWDTYSHVLPRQDEQAADLFYAHVYGSAG